jgi:Fe-S cluster assembly iron-binding protein IscA
MDEYDIEDLVNDINFEDNSISYIKGDVVLTNKEVQILTNLNIDYKKFKKMSSLLTVLNEYVIDNPELEDIIRDMSDRNYYLNTEK